MLCLKENRRVKISIDYNANRLQETTYMYLWHNAIGSIINIFSLRDRNSPHRRRRPCHTCAVAILTIFASTASFAQIPANSTQPAPKQTVNAYLGIDNAKKNSQHPIPDGRQIRIGHVEGNKGNYMPNTKLPQFKGLTLIPRSGPSKPNGHTTTTSKIAYGYNSVAPGVKFVHFFNTDHWLGSGYLNTMTEQPPASEKIDIFNHSWIGNNQSQFALDALRRIDYMVDQYDQIVVVGVNNGAGNPVPSMLASGYNSIAVGTLHGTSSGKYTQFEGSGRCKPDIVAYNSLTSYTTPMITGVTARLLEKARQMQNSPNAQRAEVIKAVLMAGALKPAKWQPANGKPLDEYLGAGWAKFDKSYKILTGGESKPGPIRSRMGWSFVTASKNHTLDYRFSINNPSKQVSIMLVWHRRIDGRWLTDPNNKKTTWKNTPRMANFDLQLVNVNSANNERTLASSRSNIDNVEHIYLKNLPAGRYRIEVLRTDELQEPWDYALAWRIEK